MYEPYSANAEGDQVWCLTNYPIFYYSRGIEAILRVEGPDLMAQQGRG